MCTNQNCDDDGKDYLFLPESKPSKVIENVL